MKIKMISIITFLIFHIIFLEISYISYYNYFVYIGIIIVAIYLLLKIKSINKKNYKLNIILGVFCLLIIISSVFNNLNVHRGILYVIKLIEVFLYFEYVNEINQKDHVIKIFFRLALIYCIASDILMILFPNLVTIFGEYYLIGNKFTISYFHIFLVALYCIKNKEKNKIAFFAFWLWSLTISVVTECSTATVGNIIYLILTLIPKEVKIKIINEKFIIVVLFISTTMLVFAPNILENKYVQSFIVNFLNEDVTLTGRLNIYTNVLPYVYEKIFWGYGYGNSYEILTNKIGAVNTQNGILENIFDYGIVATVVSVILLMFVIKRNKKEKNELYPLISLLYVFIILASVEITINIFFWGILAFLSIGKSDKNKLEEICNDGN